MHTNELVSAFYATGGGGSSSSIATAFSIHGASIARARCRRCDIGLSGLFFRFVSRLMRVRSLLLTGGMDDV